MSDNTGLLEVDIKDLKCSYKDCREKILSLTGIDIDKNEKILVHTVYSPEKKEKFLFQGSGFAFLIKYKSLDEVYLSISN